MKVELRELSSSDGMDILEMMKEIGPGENGFSNHHHNMKIEDFPSYLEANLAMAKGENLNPELVPQTTYWLLINDRLVGIGKLRHRLTEKLRKSGGHIGYTIRPSEKRKGYGTILLREILVMAKEKDLNHLLLTCTEENAAFRRIIENNNGVLDEIKDGKCKYWISFP